MCLKYVKLLPWEQSIFLARFGVTLWYLTNLTPQQQDHRNTIFWTLQQLDVCNQFTYTDVIKLLAIVREHLWWGWLGDEENWPEGDLTLGGKMSLRQWLITGFCEWLVELIVFIICDLFGTVSINNYNIVSDNQLKEKF